MQLACGVEQYLLPDSSDDMATLGDRLLDVEKTLHSLHGYAKGAVAAGLLLVAAVAWWVNASLMPSIEAIKQSTSSYESRLTTLEAQIRALDLKSRAATSPQSALKEIANLEPYSFARALPALQVVTEQPISKVNPSVQDLLTVADKLRNTDSASPDYWPTVFHFLQFATERLSQNVPPPGPPLVLSQLTASGTISGKVVEFTDGIKIENMRFVNCRIIFTEQPVEMKNVQFVDSVVEFPVLSSPNPYLQSAARVLLSSNLTSASLTFPPTQS